MKPEHENLSTDLQRLKKTPEITVDELKELQDFKFGKKGKMKDEQVMSDFAGLFLFLPEHLKHKANSFLHRANHNQVEEALIDLLEQETGESEVLQIIEFRREGDAYVSDSSNQKLYRLLLEKFKEMQRFYRWV